MELIDLSVELLVEIFSKVDVEDVLRLRMTCKRFKDVIDSWQDVILRNKNPVATNQVNSAFLARCRRKLAGFERLKISRNWRTGRFYESTPIPTRQWYMPWLKVTKEQIWISRSKYIFCHERNNKQAGIKKPQKAILRGRSNEDVVKFEIKDQLVVCGHREGSIWLKDLQSKTHFDFPNDICATPSDVQSVDINESGTAIVSGHRDYCFHLWTFHNNVIELKYSERMMDRVWKVSIQPYGKLVAIGTSAVEILDEKSLHIFDMEKLVCRSLPSSCRKGILDIKWDGPNTFWTCGYGACLKKWDLRADCCVQTMYDPQYVPMYCLDFDHYNTIVTGSQLHGRVILWDVRQKKCIQKYFMNSCKKRDSPVFSIAFDAEYLFAATDTNLNVLQFTAHKATPKDYSWFL